MAKRSASGIVIGGITVEVERDVRHSSSDAFCRDSPRTNQGKSTNSSLGDTESAFASLTIFSKATFRSPRSMPPM